MQIISPTFFTHNIYSSPYGRRIQNRIRPGYNRSFSFFAEKGTLSKVTNLQVDNKKKE